VATRTGGQNDAALVVPALTGIDVTGLEGGQDVPKEAEMTGRREKRAFATFPFIP
jgi:hypothetical protein